MAKNAMIILKFNNVKEIKMNDTLKKYMTKYTKLNESEQRSVMKELIIEEYEKGINLIKQGDFSSKKCFFVLKGCVRQYHIDEDGKEITSNFYTEEQAILLVHFEDDYTSKYSLTCLEDCILVVADIQNEQTMYKKFTELEQMTRLMMEKYLGQAQNEYASFIGSSPEKRYIAIKQKRPDLLTRVPQHQLASYLGMTPESLSRIKKRIQ